MISAATLACSIFDVYSLAVVIEEVLVGAAKGPGVFGWVKYGPKSSPEWQSCRIPALTIVGGPPRHQHRRHCQRGFVAKLGTRAVGAEGESPITRLQVQSEQCLAQGKWLRAQNLLTRGSADIVVKALCVGVFY